MSKLFTIASAAARRYARRQFSRTPVGQLVKEVQRHTRGRGSSRRMSRMVNRVSSREAVDLMKAVENATNDKYAAKERSKNLGRLLNLLGPLGNIISSIIGAPSAGRTFGDDQAEAAAELIRSLGGEVLTKPGSKGFKRGLDAATELISESIKPPPIPTVDDDEEISIQTLGRGSIGYDDEAAAELISKEIVVSSSNVYSFVYEPESRRHGILYVTFLAWSPGVKRRSGPGPTYAYYDLPLAKYKRFASAATTQSAGAAVWDYLRERGTVAGHQHTYRIVSGTLVQGGGQYIPRKATSKGFKKRAVLESGVGRRGFSRSTLPERSFSSRREALGSAANRGTPNRARPNRGRP